MVHGTLESYNWYMTLTEKQNYCSRLQQHYEALEFENINRGIHDNTVKIPNKNLRL